MEIDYNNIGFKCGLECHQQLEGRKLFCSCPVLNSDKEADIHVERRLKSVAGETGEKDAAAEFEMSKNKKFLYESSSEDTCLVEYDEEPPHEINREALETTMKIALLLNAKIVDEMQVMRKTVIDGSNVSGFQRTALVAMDGFIETSMGKVHIPTICLEEEAAQKLEEKEDYVKYKLDRLGIPLIEIATSADIKSPEHAKEAAGHIGMILRSVEGVKRGLGTIRQDVNISIEKGARTEVKGFQDLRSIPKVIEYEIKRQLEAIKHGKKLEREVRKAEQDFTTSFLRPLPGAARLYPETDVIPARVSSEMIESLRKELPSLLADKIADFEKKFWLSKEMAKEVVDSDIFTELADKLKNVGPSFIAHALINVPKELKRRYELDASMLAKKDFEEVLGCLDKGKITKEAVIEIFADVIRGGKIDLKKYAAVAEDDIEGEIKKIVDSKPGLNISAYMGLVMTKYRGKIEGKKVMEILKKIMN